MDRKNSPPLLNTHSKEPDYKFLYEELSRKHQFMLSQISHEIRNPITLINSFLQIFETQNPSLTEDCCWKKIMENMSFLRALLNEFSEFNSSTKLSSQTISLSELLYDILESVRPVYSTFHIQVLLHEETPVPAVFADKTKLSQLILNLLKNAREAIGTHGTIICTLRADGNFAQLSVSDTGPGVPEIYQKNLFEPFVTHKEEGTGLGLAICKRIAEAHGGNIFYSSTPGKGASFSVTLPLK